MRISEICRLLDYDYCGDETLELTGIAYAEVARTDELAVALRNKEVFNTSAAAVLVQPILTKTSKTLLMPFEPIECALVRIAKLFIRCGRYNDYSRPTELFAATHGFYMGANCHIGDGTSIAPGAIIESGATIGQGCVIEAGAVIKQNVVLGNDVRIGVGTVIGADAFYNFECNGCLNSFCGIGSVRLGDFVEIGSHTTIQRGVASDTVIGNNTKIGNSVDIGHDVRVGKNCLIVSQTGIASMASLEDNVRLYGQVGIANNVIIRTGATVLGKSLVSKEVSAYDTVSGIYARKHTEALRTQVELMKR